MAYPCAKKNKKWTENLKRRPAMKSERYNWQEEEFCRVMILRDLQNRALLLRALFIDQREFAFALHGDRNKSTLLLLKK